MEMDFVSRSKKFFLIKTYKKNLTYSDRNNNSCIDYYICSYINTNDASIENLSCPGGLFFDLYNRFCNKKELVECENVNFDKEFEKLLQSTKVSSIQYKTDKILQSSTTIAVQSSPILQSSTESAQTSTPIAVKSSSIIQSTTISSETSSQISISSDIGSTSPIIEENSEKVTTTEAQTKSVSNEASEICPKGDGYC